MIRDIILSPIFLVTLSVGVYYGTLVLYRKVRWGLLNPVLVSMLVIIGVLKILDVPFETYYQANSIINFMLGLSVVALGYLLHENIRHIRGKALSILVATFIGSVVGVVGVVVMARLLDVDHAISVSLQPKSVTTPIALAISHNQGGIEALTSIAVVMVGILGSIIGPWLLTRLGVNSPVARGLAMGSASHAVGTAKAMELGAVEGAVAGAAIGIMGVMTTLIVPLVEKIMDSL